MTDIDAPSIDSDRYREIDIYRAAARHSTEIVAILDREGVVTYASPSFRRILGHEPHDVVGRTAFAQVHPDDIASLHEIFGSALRSPGSTVTVQYRYRHADGSWKVLESIGSNQFDDPSVAGFVVNSRDITGHAALATQLRERESEYRRIFEASSDGMVINRLDGGFVAANPAMCRMHGYTLEEFLQVSPQDIIHPDHHGIFVEYMATILGGGAFQTRAVDRRKDGSFFPVEVHGTLFIYRGEPHVLGVVRDVTERVSAQEQLQERDAQYRAIFESSSDGLIINEPTTGVVVEANPAICRMHGYSREEFIGRPSTTFIHSDYHYVLDEFPRLLAGEGTHQVQAVGVRKDGSSFPVEVHGSTVIYQGTLHILAVVRDITERVRTERAVQEERQRLSRELHDSVSQALYSIALGGKTARVLLDRDPRKAIESIDFVLAQAERGLAEMRSLILELRPEMLEQDGLAGALQKQAEAIAVRHGVEVSTALCGEPNASITVKEALYRVAIEALHNAVKHSGASRLHIGLDCGGDMVTLEVADNGKGFDTAGEFPGHVGLQSMRERAQLVGGSLHLDSHPGAGTVIRALVPRRRSSNARRIS